MSTVELQSSSSTSAIVITLRPKGKHFHEGAKSRQSEAGFQSIPRSLGGMGLLDGDTREPIAVITADNDSRWHMPLTEFTITIEPETCAIEYKAGTRFIKVLKDFLVLIGGNAYVDSKKLSDPDLDELARTIDKLMLRRRDEAYAARLQRLPNGEIRRTGVLSFQHQIVKEAGSRKKSYRTVNFDCSGVERHDACVRGIEMAEELIEFFKTHRVESPDLMATLREAFRIHDEGASLPYNKQTERSVASGFLHVITTLIRTGSQNINPRWLENEKRQYQDVAERMKSLEADQKAEFVERMRAARAAAKAKRSQSSKGRKAK